MHILLDKYKEALASQALQPDTAQEKAVRALDDVITRTKKKDKGGFSLFKREKPHKGLYLYGPVGRGKTMLMDWCLHALEALDIKAERWHFHAFMLEIHFNLKSKISAKKLDNRIEQIADIWAKRVEVLCFDEFHVTDVADAMIMMPLFTRLFERGVTVIATSNWVPDDLYSGGLQRQRFLPFIETLKQRMEIVNVAGETDYRAAKRQSSAAWLYPLDGETEDKFDLLFRDAVGYDPIETHELHVGTKEHGRTWILPFASKSTVKVDIAAFLSQPLGAADFMALADRYPLIFLDNLEPFTTDSRDKSKRFMVMIDVLYDKGIKLVVRADTPPEGLYPSDGSLQFEFSRTISRLKEMTPLRTAE